MSNSMSMIF